MSNGLVQTVFKGYQWMTKVAVSKDRVKHEHIHSTPSMFFRMTVTKKILK